RDPYEFPVTLWSDCAEWRTLGAYVRRLSDTGHLICQRRRMALAVVHQMVRHRWRVVRAYSRQELREPAQLLGVAWQPSRHQPLPDRLRVRAYPQQVHRRAAERGDERPPLFAVMHLAGERCAEHHRAAVRPDLGRDRRHALVLVE